ncbi:MAG: alanine--glyoxylate aminotransferase family protein [Vampirovibrio sp.]
MTVPHYPFLMIPGPTPLPDAVREVMGRPAVGHRSPEFKEIMKRVLPNLQAVFQTQHPVIVYTASATGAIEAALTNTLNAGETILVLSCGVFSRRWGDMAKSLGLVVETLNVEDGQINTVEALQTRLLADTAHTIKAVIFVHSETSTGALNDVKALVRVIREHGALSMVDTVTGLSADAFKMDEWGIDLAMSGSQKGFMMPPGLSFLAVGERALARHQQVVQHPGFYFNFTRNLNAQAEYTTAYTPATHLIMALDVSLQMMLEEGLEAMNQRHGRLRDMVRAGVRAMGLRPLVEDDADASPAVTAVLPPEGVEAPLIRKILKDRFSITVADGQARLKGKIFRIGHLGFVGERDVYMVLACLEHALHALGHPVGLGAGIHAAQAVALAEGSKQTITV